MKVKVAPCARQHSGDWANVPNSPFVWRVEGGTLYVLHCATQELTHCALARVPWYIEIVLRKQKAGEIVQVPVLPEPEGAQ